MAFIHRKDLRIPPLCHKDTAKGAKGHLKWGPFACLEMCLYGMIELVLFWELESSTLATGCKGWGYIWAADLSDLGNCNLKSQIDKGPLNEKRTAYVARWKGGQMVHIDKGSLCPGGHLYIHTYVKPNRLNDAASFTSERLLY